MLYKTHILHTRSVVWRWLCGAEKEMKECLRFSIKTNAWYDASHFLSFFLKFCFLSSATESIAKRCALQRAMISRSGRTQIFRPTPPTHHDVWVLVRHTVVQRRFPRASGVAYLDDGSTVGFFHWRGPSESYSCFVFYHTQSFWQRQNVVTKLGCV